MAKRKKKIVVVTPVTPPPIPAYPKEVKRWVAGGGGMALIGFLLLLFTDPSGQNWASTLAPLLILAGYAGIGYGFFLAE